MDAEVEANVAGGWGTPAIPATVWEAQVFGWAPESLGWGFLALRWAPESLR